MDASKIRRRHEIQRNSRDNRRALVTRRVPVQRRSRARVELILKASTELLADGGVDALTTRSLAEHTGIPVATIYRYFDNRDAIITAYLDHELEQIERSVTATLMTLDRVTFRTIAEAIALAHMRHHQNNPEGIPVWCSTRGSPSRCARPSPGPG
jgi:AcrR family transcriptional regulator